MNILIGCDPELFLRDETGAFVSGHGVLPGTKNKPHRVNKGAVQIDGTALEFNTDPAATCAEFLANVDAVMGQMKEMVGVREIAAVPVAEYTEEYFNTIPAEALELGCDPDFNAWERKANPRPNGRWTFRTGSGHVHIGWGSGFNQYSREHMELSAAMARQMDYYLGVATLLWDDDDRRRTMYGMAGAFRPKSYGMEYRVPSNRWLASKDIQEFVYNAAHKAATDFFNGVVKEDTYGDVARSIINQGRRDWRNEYDFETGLDYSKVA